jgi:hypothetical protein
LQTVHVGGSINGQWGPFGVHGSGGLVLDSHGNLGGYLTGGAGGVKGGGDGLVGGFTVGGSDAETICDLEGLFANGSIGGGDGFGASAEGFAGSSPRTGKPVVGGGITVGPAIGAGSSVGVTNTSVFPIGDLW